MTDKEDYFVHIHLGINDIDSVADENDEDDEEAAMEGHVAQAASSNPLAKLHKGI
jgi:hypothetical protein